VEGITDICDFIASLPDKFYQWGVEMIQSLIDGIRSMIGAVGDAIGEVASKIAEYIHFSEPDKGPLSNFNSFMPDMMKQMAEQIEAGRYQVKIAAANVAADIAAPMAGARNVTLNNNFTFGGGYTEADGRSIVRQINRQLGALYI
jgi:phage-related protein